MGGRGGSSKLHFTESVICFCKMVHKGEQGKKLSKKWFTWFINDPQCQIQFGQFGKHKIELLTEAEEAFLISIV